MDTWATPMAALQFPNSKPVQSLMHHRLYETVSFPMWVLYDHPRDWPGFYVLRLWDGATNRETPFIKIAETLEEIESCIDECGERWHMLPRFESDDPKILRVYI
jgi:hypothetical protein